MHWSKSAGSNGLSDLWSNGLNDAWWMAQDGVDGGMTVDANAVKRSSAEPPDRTDITDNMQKHHVPLLNRNCAK